MTSALPDGLLADAADHRTAGQAEPQRAPASLGRIAIVVSSLDGDPAADAALAWTSYFAEAGEDVEVVAIREGRRHGDLPASVRVWRPRRHVIAGTSRALAGLLSRRRYDVVVAVGTVSNLAAVAARARSSHRPILLLAEQDVLSLNAAAGSSRVRARVWLARHRYRHADAVISPSHAVAAEIAAAFGVPSSRSLVVPNPVLRRAARSGRATATESVVPAAHPREPGTSAGVQLVLLGSLAPVNRPELAVLTAQALSERGVPADVIALEGGPLSDRLAAFAASMGVGFRSVAGAAHPYLEIGPRAVGLLPSPRQGSGDELVRAAARGLPSVALSTALGVADGIIPGVTGQLALDDDPRSVADAVEAAASLVIEDIDGWLKRFTADDSTASLVEVIAYVSAERA